MKSSTRAKSFVKAMLVLQMCTSRASTMIFPYGTSVGDTKLTTESSPLINLDLSFPYYGGSYQTIQLYEDGFITLNDNQLRTTYLFDSTEVAFAAIVPWLARMSASQSSGQVSYRLTKNSTVLNEISTFAAKFVEFTYFIPTYAFIATWENVGTNFFDSSKNNKVNSFQMAMAWNGTQSLVLMSYIKIEWVFWDDSSYYGDYGNIEDFPQGFIKTEVSFHKGDQSSHVRLPVSYKAELLDIVSDSNVNQSGVYAFKVDTTPTNLTVIEQTSVVSSTTSTTVTTTSTTAANTTPIPAASTTVTTAASTTVTTTANTTVTTTASTTVTTTASTTATTTATTTSTHKNLQTDTELIIGLSCAGILLLLLLMLSVILCCKLKFCKKAPSSRVSPNNISYKLDAKNS